MAICQLPGVNCGTFFLGDHDANAFETGMFNIMIISGTGMSENGDLVYQFVKYGSDI